MAESYDNTLRYGAQTPFSDQLASRWEGGEWQADALHDSITTVGNGGSKPMRAGFTLYYDRGQRRYDLEQQLAPNEQMWVDIGSLIRTGRPDIHGTVLPASLTTGSYQFRDSTNTPVGSLFEGKVIYDLSNGHVSYGCGTCCSTTGVYLTYDPFALGLNSSFTNGVWTKDDCGDPADNDSSSFYNWSTANAAIATTTKVGLHTGMSVGGTTSTTSGEVIHANGRNGCYLVPISPGGPTNVLSAVVNSADVTTDTISVTLSGPQTTGTLSIVLVGNPSQTIYQSSASNGTASYSFHLSSVPAQEFTGVTATWSGSGGSATNTLSYHIRVLGVTNLTQYNTPSESQCSGTPQADTIYNNSCVVTNANLNSGFIFRVTNPSGGTGSGNSINFGSVYQEAYCSGYSSTSLRSFQTITGTLGSLGPTTLAACQSSPDYVSGARIYIQGVGVKTVEDRCPGCCKDLPHFDNYSTSGQCSGLGSLASAITVRIY